MTSKHRRQAAYLCRVVATLTLFRRNRMMKFGDRLYVKGYTEITPAAVERLKELGVELRRSPRGYDSFFLPEGVDGGGVPPQVWQPRVRRNTAPQV